PGLAAAQEGGEQGAPRPRRPDRAVLAAYLTAATTSTCLPSPVRSSVSAFTNEWKVRPFTFVAPSTSPTGRRRRSRSVPANPLGSSMETWATPTPVSISYESGPNPVCTLPTPL